MLPDKCQRSRPGLFGIINRGKQLLAILPQAVSHQCNHGVTCANGCSLDTSDPIYRLGHAEGYSKGLKTGIGIGILTGVVTTYAPPLVETYRIVGDGLKAGANGWASCLAFVVMSVVVLIALGVGLAYSWTTRAR